MSNPTKSWFAILSWSLGLIVMAALSHFYYQGATANAKLVNRNAHSGDQSSYMEYARDIYLNRHDPNSNILGDRNRMPIYPWIQSFFFDPEKSEQYVRYDGYRAHRDLEFFEVGKEVNIKLSLYLLILLFFILLIDLPALAAASVTIVLAFGVFIFKAGYFQAELLFYFAFFVSFLLMFHLLRRPRLWLGALAGVVIALAHLVKAAMLPILGLFIAAYLGREIVILFIRIIRPDSAILPTRPKFLWRIATLLLTLACFVATLWPYIHNSKQAFGQYFYNVNSTFYIWYDKWRDVSHPVTGTKAHGDRVHWPDIPDEKLPSPQKYLKEHTREQIKDRLSTGFKAMYAESREHYGYFWFSVAFLAFALLMIAIHPIRWWQGVTRNCNWAAFIFLLFYGVSYFYLTAFYEPISATGTTRFLLANMAPFLYSIAWLTTRKPLQPIGPPIGKFQFTTLYLHAAIIIAMLIALPQHIWPRLMDAKKFGGY